MSPNQESAGAILVVDDNAFVLETTALLLKGSGYSVASTTEAIDAVNMVRRQKFDMVLTDIKMPGITGIELLEKVRSLDSSMPVILMTAYAELDAAVDAVKKGAFDFIIKPYKTEYLLHAVGKAVNYSRLTRMEKDYKLRLEEDVRKRTAELQAALTMVKEMSKEVAHRLTAVAEYRDTDTGAHIKRIGLYTGALASAIGMPSDYVEAITFASPMHDIGKIGIPDSILLKPAGLTPEEAEVMKRHTVIGQSMLEDSTYPTLRLASVIALTHHERWDGTGYPRGLKGADIPLEGRIVIIADQYDALRSKRPYKPPFSHDETMRIMTIGDKRTMPGHFEPALLKVFVDIAPEFDGIFRGHQDL
ncbi:MAG: response regulator [Deltaproteobacteria bacterium]|nr:response regulator [Deltaproteobacteria bacterium]